MKQHTTPSCAGQVSAAAPSKVGGACVFFAILPHRPWAPPHPIYFQVGGPLEVNPEFAYHDKVGGCALVSVTLLASSLPVLLKVAHLLLWKVHR